MNKFKLLSNDFWITTDTHFDHKAITNFEPQRAYLMNQDGIIEIATESHTEWLINRWNSIVKPNDTVLHLGDFAFKNVANIKDRLNGNIILIFGNHDDSYNKKKFDDFIKVDGVYLIKNNMSFKLDIEDKDEKLSALIIGDVMYCHYPLFNSCKFDRKNQKINERVKILEDIFTKMNCKINVHGHTHSAMSTFENSINVCMDAFLSEDRNILTKWGVYDCKPIKIKELNV